MNKYFDLTGKVAVVTGASSGLGASAAVAYAESGAKVALLARRQEKLEITKKKIEEIGGTAIAVKCDVSKEEDVKNAFDQIISTFGTVDILLNAAGVVVLGGVEAVDLEGWNRALNTNLTGQMLTAKYAIPYMKEKKYGKIVNIASVNALYADKDDAIARHSYNATKGGVLGLTKGMAGTYAKYGITVNAIGPGLFPTEMTEDLLAMPGYMDVFGAKNPTGRPGKPDELNGAVLFLSSNASSYVQGQLILVDGGDTLV